MLIGDIAMDDVSFEVESLARRYGVDPSKMTDQQYRFLALRAMRTAKSKAAAVASAVGSRVRTGFFGARISAEEEQKNVDVCVACPDGKYRVLADGAPVCEECGCSGKFLRSKWIDPVQKCPKGHWTNEGRKAVSLTIDGDPPAEV